MQKTKNRKAQPCEKHFFTITYYFQKPSRTDLVKSEERKVKSPFLRMRIFGCDAEKDIDHILYNYRFPSEWN